MRVSTGPTQGWAPADVPAAVTIGVFDGVHLGHQSLLRLLGHDLERTVLTFDPHPLEVLRPGTPPRLLTTIEERLGLFEEHGVDHVGVLDLVDVKDMAPERFIEDVLIAKVGVGRIVTGPDFRFGKDRTGDVGLLTHAGDRAGFTVELAPMVTTGDEAVSSSMIRSLLETGEPERAATLLGRPFFVTGAVVHGDHRGMELGFPTANLATPPRKVLPAFGVYAGRVQVEGLYHRAAMNIGVRPTFGAGDPVIEAHLIDFDGDIYGHDLVVELSHYLRPEIQYGDVEELIRQIRADVEAARGLIDLPPGAG